MDTCRILVVDDEPDLEDLVNQRMRREIRSGRYSFVFARNGVEALERLNGDNAIDIVITDINMPEMDGLTLLEQIPAYDPKFRCVIVSAYGDMKNIRTAMNRGAFDFLNKPIDFEDFRRTIDKSIEHLAQVREAFEARDKMLTEGRSVEEPHRILVVDDEPDLEQLVLQRMRREIRRGRYSFVFARNGVEALERLNENGADDIDMVLTDINMPEMDGLTLLKQIPSVDPNVRSVVVSAYGDMKNIRTAMNRGAFDFLNKPIDFEDLRLTIEKSLEHLKSMREAFEERDKMLAEGRP